MVSVFSLSLLIQGCEADVDLNNIDTSVKVNANVATPIGSIRATLGDFFGDGTFGISIDSVKNHGVLTFRDTFSIERNFHQIDLSKYIGTAELDLDVYNQLQLGLVGGKLQGNGEQIKFQFPLTLKLKGINHLVSSQRIDSALIKNASFVSTINPVGNLPIKWEWIDKVTINLGENFHRPAGDSITIYQKKPLI